MEVFKSFFGPERHFEDKLEDSNIDYKKIGIIKPYKLGGLSGGAEYNVYEYHMRNGQRVLLCTTHIISVDDVSEEALMLKLKEGEAYTLEQISQLIIDYNDYFDNSSLLEVVYTFVEACEKWGIPDSELMTAVERGVFIEGKEYKKSGMV